MSISVVLGTEELTSTGNSVNSKTSREETTLADSKRSIREYTAGKVGSYDFGTDDLDTITENSIGEDKGFISGSNSQ